MLFLGKSGDLPGVAEEFRIVSNLLQAGLLTYTLAMIPPDFIQSLLQRVDIIDVIDQRVQLKKAGANFVACCPFHSEKTPSFSVSPTKQFYHCFGCGAHGTAISFLMEYAGMPFPDAVRELADQVGLQVPQQSGSARPSVNADDGPSLSELLTKALHYYREQLKQSPQAIDYLKQRGVSGQIAARFGVGFAPEGWQNLGSAFDRYEDPALVTAGLVIEGDNGKRYDRFRDRVMFPIFSQRGETIGFGGRVIGQGEPKYLNSPETPIFEKGRELYGLTQALRAIRDSKTVIVVEGYMDVVALAQHGVENVVATLGTATTPVHAQRLLRLTDHLVFCFDGDGAGRRAAWRALENCLPVLTDGKEAKFLFLPQGEDPDSFIRANGKEKFDELVRDATPLSGYLIRELSERSDLKVEEGRAAFLQHAKPLLKEIQAPLLSLLLRNRLAEIAGVTREDLDQTLDISAPRRSQAPIGRNPTRRQQPSLALQLCTQIALLPRLASAMDVDLSGQPNAEERVLQQLVAFCGGQPHLMHSAEVELFFDGLSDSARVALIRETMAQKSMLSDQEIEAEFQDCVAKLKLELRHRAMNALAAQLSGKKLTDEAKQSLKDFGLHA